MKITTKGFGPWKKTIVEHGETTTTFSGSVSIDKKDGATCVTEKGLFSNNSTCFIEEPAAGGVGATHLPDGELVGRSKSIEIRKGDGNVARYDSKPMAINRLEKTGDEVRVISKGLLGEKVVDRLSAQDVVAINSEDCSVCRKLNPLYKSANPEENCHEKQDHAGRYVRQGDDAQEPAFRFD